MRVAVTGGTGKLGRIVAGEQLQGFIIGLRIQQHASQTHCGDSHVFLAATVIDHPLQLLLGGLDVIGIEGRTGSHQGAHLGVGRAAELVLDVAGSALHLGIVLGGERLLLLFV